MVMMVKNDRYQYYELLTAMQALRLIDPLQRATVNLSIQRNIQVYRAEYIKTHWPLGQLAGLSALRPK